MTTRRDFLTGAAYLTAGAAAGVTLGRVTDLRSTAHRVLPEQPAITRYLWVTAKRYMDHYRSVSNVVVVGHSTMNRDMVLIAYREDGSPVPWTDHTPRFLAVFDSSLEEVMIDIGC